MERRTPREIERRLALVLAQSFHSITFARWDSISEDGSVARLNATVGEDARLVVFLDYKGSALLRLDGKPFWSLDGYHKSAKLPLGKHELVAEFTPYLAFGEKTAISPGVPIFAGRNEEAYRFWVHGHMAFELARQSKDKELSDDLTKQLSDSLKEAYFEGVTHEQLVIANYLSEKFPKELVEIIPKSSKQMESIGYRYDNNSVRWKRALDKLEEGLEELVRKYGKRGEILAIAHGHIDTAWLWPFHETEKKVARTFSVVSTLMEDHEDFHYFQSMALYYEWTKENQPQLYEKIKSYVKSGRWELGAGWVENDANILSGESFARQLLYSQRFYQKEFGKRAETYWLPDTFGFAASIPQIAKLGGIKLFATHKLFWNDTNTFPYSLFNWIGIDGTALPSIAFGRGRDGYNSTFAIEEIIEQWTNWTDKDVELPMLYSFGFGDGGGGPTEEMLVKADAVNKLPILPKVRLNGKSSKGPSFLVQNYSQPTSPGFTKNVWRDELYLERHRGVQTSHTRIKYLNRRTEFALRDAELWSTILSSTRKRGGTVYNTTEFEDLWKILLKHQFHDVLPGSSINEVYVTAYRELETVLARANQIIDNCTKELANLHAEGTPYNEEAIVLFNSLPWVRDQEYVVLADEAAGSQKIEDGYLIRATVPGIGYLRLNESASDQEPIQEGVHVIDSHDSFLIENKFFKILVEKKGGTIRSIFDKEAQREVLKARSNVFAFYENIPGWGDAWDIEPGYKTTSFEVAEAEECALVEHGPLRVRIKVRMRKFRHSRLEQEIIVFGASRRIDFKTTTEMHDRELLVKNWFHLDLNSDNAVFDIPYGNLERKTNTNTSWEKAKFEVPMQKWADLSETDYGVAVLNDGRYGISVEQSSIGLSLAKTPIYPDYATDSEPSTFTFSVYPHLGPWHEALVPQKAYELNSPIRVSKTLKKVSLSHSTAKDNPVEQGSFIRVDSTNIMLEAVKKAEDDESIVLRLYEMHNKRGRVQLRFWKKISAAKSTDLLETTNLPAKLEVQGDTVTVPYSNYEIMTLKVDLTSTPIAHSIDNTLSATRAR